MFVRSLVATDRFNDAEPRNRLRPQIESHGHGANDRRRENRRHRGRVRRQPDPLFENQVEDGARKHRERQRPIVVRGDRAVLARPVASIEELL